MKAVLFGASKGMGRALARRMAARGDRLFLLEHVAEELALSARDLEMRGAPKPVKTAYCDLLQPATFAPALDEAQRELGGFDAVVVTAGLYATQEELESDSALAARLLAADFANTVLFCEEARKRLLCTPHAPRQDDCTPHAPREGAGVKFGAGLLKFGAGLLKFGAGLLTPPKGPTSDLLAAGRPAASDMAAQSETGHNSVARSETGQNGGTLCVFSSVAGERGRKPVVLYGAAKAGLSHYLEGLDHKFRARGLRTICVKPGFVKTGMTVGLKPPPFAGTPDEVAQRVLKAIDRGWPEVYVPSMWRWVMCVIRRLPRWVMRRIGF